MCWYNRHYCHQIVINSNNYSNYVKKCINCTTYNIQLNNIQLYYIQHSIVQNTIYKLFNIENTTHNCSTQLAAHDNTAHRSTNSAKVQYQHMSLAKWLFTVRYPKHSYTIDYKAHRGLWWDVRIALLTL